MNSKLDSSSQRSESLRRVPVQPSIQLLGKHRPVLHDGANISCISYKPTTPSEQDLRSDPSKSLFSHREYIQSILIIIPSSFSLALQEEVSLSPITLTGAFSGYHGPQLRRYFPFNRNRTP